DKLRPLQRTEIIFLSTRQRCPASPVIFTLALEPLACAIRNNQNITGITLFNYDFKANLYADDILLTLSRPTLSVPHLMKLISDFSTFFGYKINWFKSEAISLNRLTHPSHLNSIPVAWRSEGMRYLGVNIRSPIDSIFESNGPKLLKTIRDDLNRWTNLPLSLWGRAEVLKMNVLPKLAFLFSAIPLEIPQKWFIEIDKSFSLFLRKGKKPRIGRKKLVVPRNKGGLGTQDVYAHYLSYNESRLKARLCNHVNSFFIFISQVKTN
uniref:Reverse transcriptase domain-containing protein n=1 Tax=Seriola dumerili TaxID=41447 RepID=A0A3B4VFF3_SERDU